MSTKIFHFLCVILRNVQSGTGTTVTFPALCDTCFTLRPVQPNVLCVWSPKHLLKLHFSDHLQLTGTHTAADSNVNMSSFPVRVAHLNSTVSES